MYSVLYREQAVDDLARIWLNADPTLRAQITEATAELEDALGRNPSKVGESREVHLRQFAGGI